MAYQSDLRLDSLQTLWACHPFTQREAAPLLGISQSALSQYLSGTIPLNTDIIIKFSKFFKVKPEVIDSSLSF